jgi:threonyl-tRNA synthetase
METDMLDDSDHRSLGQRLGLFHFQEEAPGMVFWHPRGFRLYQLLEAAIRRHMRRQRFEEVRAPQVLRQSIWEASGHWANFSAGMFVLEGEEPRAALKPVNCPGHIQIVKRMAPSYRDLPLRLGELGVVHRDEPSGTLLGLFRLRQFTQDDGHIFCEEPDIEREVVAFCASLREFYEAFGFAEISVGFSTRPAERAGSDEVWDRAEAVLLAAARAAGLSPEHQPGQGAFYGPKLEFVLRDRLGRSWQCGTIQLDFVLPERFDLRYVDASGARRRPAMLHRATLGSLERFLGVLLEHHAGALPAWLAPDQVIVAPVAEAHHPYASRVLERLEAAGLRASLDARAETLARKVVLAHEAGAPFLIVVGKREAERAAITIRERDGRQREASLEDGVADLARQCAPPL